MTCIISDTDQGLAQVLITTGKFFPRILFHGRSDYSIVPVVRQLDGNNTAHEFPHVQTDYFVAVLAGQRLIEWKWKCPGGQWRLADAIADSCFRETLSGPPVVAIQAHR